MHKTRSVWKAEGTTAEYWKKKLENHYRKVTSSSDFQSKSVHFQVQLVEWFESQSRLLTAKATGRNTRGRALLLEDPEVLQQITKYAGKCAYCGGPFEHLDHFVPLSLGGTDEASNLLPSCASCNLRKNAKAPSAWYKYLFGVPYWPQWASFARDFRMVSKQNDTGP